MLSNTECLLDLDGTALRKRQPLRVCLKSSVQTLLLPQDDRPMKNYLFCFYDAVERKFILNVRIKFYYLALT